MKLRLASCDQIRRQSRGEITKAETFDHRSRRCAIGGLLCERTFGATRNWECACGKYSGRPYEGATCERCGVTVSASSVRLKHFGHVELAIELLNPLAIYRSDRLGNALGLSILELQQIAHYELFLIPGDADSAEASRLIEPRDLRPSSDSSAGSANVLRGAAAVRRLMSNRGVSDLEPLLLKALPVLPAGFRDVWTDIRYDEVVVPDLNSRYFSVVYHNERLKKLIDLNAPEAILLNQAKMLQKFLDALFCGEIATPAAQRDCLEGALVETQASLLQKPVDYSACGVVAASAEVVSGQIGLPQWAVLRLYQPWIVGLLIAWGYADTVRGAARLLRSRLAPALLTELSRSAIAGRPILVVTAQRRFAALQPVWVEGGVMTMHPSQAEQLGLSFNGELLTLHLPLTDEAVREVKSPQPQEAPKSELSAWTSELVMQLAAEGVDFELLPIDAIALGANWSFDATVVASEASVAPKDRPISTLELPARLEEIVRTRGAATIHDLVESQFRLSDWHELSERDAALLLDRLDSLGLKQAPPREAAADVARMHSSEEIQDVEVERIEMSVRARSTLRRTGIRTISQLVRCSEDDLMSDRRCGVTVVAELRAMLAKMGLSLGASSD